MTRGYGFAWRNEGSGPGAARAEIAVLLAKHPNGACGIPSAGCGRRPTFYRREPRQQFTFSGGKNMHMPTNRLFGGAIATAVASTALVGLAPTAAHAADSDVVISEIMYHAPDPDLTGSSSWPTGATRRWTSLGGASAPGSRS